MICPQNRFHLFLVMFPDLERCENACCINMALIYALLLQIQGTGTSAHILQADIPACNSNVILIMDGLLLPFAT